MIKKETRLSAKKAASVLLVLGFIFSFVACGQTGKGQNEKGENATVQNDEFSESVLQKESTAEPSTGSNGTEKTLVVYFSWSSSGNTEKMANVIKERTGGQILKIEPTAAYPTDYSECGDVAKAERDENARPKISNMPESVDEYDTIFVGYPIWWHTAPMIIGTFLENYNLTGKEIYPFSQSASMDVEQFENSMEFVRASAKGANVHDGLFIGASDTDGILAYLSQNGF